MTQGTEFKAGNPGLRAGVLATVVVGEDTLDWAERYSDHALLYFEVEVA